MELSSDLSVHCTTAGKAELIRSSDRGIRGGGVLVHAPTSLLRGRGWVARTRVSMASNAAAYNKKVVEEQYLFFSLSPTFRPSSTVFSSAARIDTSVGTSLSCRG